VLRGKLYFTTGIFLAFPELSFLTKVHNLPQLFGRLCGHLGIQNAFCHVGYHQGNGKAEVAGKILKNFM
jgi:hypothetical protein